MRQSIDLPDWIDPKAWAGFVEMRKRKGQRAPFTDRAAELIIAKLGRLREDGQDPNAMLDQSTLNGWSGVFEVRDQESKGRLHRQSAAARRREELNKALEADHKSEDDVPF